MVVGMVGGVVYHYISIRGFSVNFQLNVIVVSPVPPCPPVNKITNLFRKTGLKIAFRPTNTVFQQLTQKPKKQPNIST